MNDSRYGSISLHSNENIPFVFVENQPIPGIPPNNLLNYILNTKLTSSSKYPDKSAFKVGNLTLSTDGNESKPRTFNTDANLWELLNDAENSFALIQYYENALWTIPPFITGQESKSGEIPRAPIGYRCNFDATMLRIMTKMIDLAPKTNQGKLENYYYAIKLLQWLLHARVEGKNELNIKRFFLQCLRRASSLKVWYTTLAQGAGNTSIKWGSRQWTIERDDLVLKESAFGNSKENVAPTVSKEANKVKTKRYLDKVTGSYRNNNNKSFGNKNNIKKEPINSQRSSANWRAPGSAPLLKDFFNPNWHKTQWVGGTETPSDYCELFQSDKCFKSTNPDCSKFHRCKWCGKPHPAIRCRNFKG